MRVIGQIGWITPTHNLAGASAPGVGIEVPFDNVPKSEGFESGGPLSAPPRVLLPKSAKPDLVSTDDPRLLRQFGLSKNPITARQALLKLELMAASNENHQLEPYQQVYGDLQGARLYLDKAITRVAIEPDPEELGAAQKTFEAYQDHAALEALLHLRDESRHDLAWSEEPTQDSVSRLLGEPDLQLNPSQLNRLSEWLKREDAKELFEPHLETLTHLAQPWEPTRYRESRSFFVKELVQKFPAVAEADFVVRELLPLAQAGSGVIAGGVITSIWEYQPELVESTMQAWSCAPHRARPNYADFQLLKSAVEEHDWLPQGRALEKLASFTLVEDPDTRGKAYRLLAQVAERRPGHLDDLQLPVDGTMLPLKEALLAQVVSSEDISLDFIKGPAEPALKLALADVELAERTQRLVVESYADGQPTTEARNALAILVHHGNLEPLYPVFHNHLREVQSDSDEQRVFDRLRRRVVSGGMKNLKDKPLYWPEVRDLLMVNSSMHRLSVLPTGNSPMARDAADRYDEEWWHRRVLEEVPKIPVHHPIVGKLWSEISNKPYSRETLPEVELLDFVTGRDEQSSQRLFRWLEPQLGTLHFERRDIYHHMAKKIVGAEIRRQRQGYTSQETSPEERLAALDKAVELEVSPVNGGSSKRLREKWHQEYFLKSLETDRDFAPLRDEDPAISVKRYRAVVATELPWSEACETVGKRVLAGGDVEQPRTGIDFDLGVDYLRVGDFELDRL